MTPRVTPAAIVVGDRVADKRWGSSQRPGRGTVVAVHVDTATVRWDGSGNDGVRALSMLRKLEGGET